MVTDEMVEKAARRMAVADGQNPDKLSHNSFEWWRHYVPMARAALEAALSADEPVGEPMELPYKNWRGEISNRKLQPIRVEFGATEWHPEPQWLLVARDIEKNTERSFALKDFNPPQPAPSVAVKALEWQRVVGDVEVAGSYKLDRMRPWTGSKPKMYWVQIALGFGFKTIATLCETVEEAKAAAQSDYEARIRSALSAQVQDVAGLERLRDVAYAVQHNPNCPAKYLVRLVGKSGRIDLKPYGNHFPSVKRETGDVLGFGKTIDEAIDNALAAAAPAKQEGVADGC